MATLREIKQRIKGIKNTQQITKAMKMVAAAKMRRAQERMFSARPYASKIQELIQNLAANANETESPLLAIRPVERLRLVVVTSDRGLCGSFNSNVIKRALLEIRNNQDKEISLVTVGKKAGEFFRKRDFNVIASYDGIFNDLQYAHADNLAQAIMKDFSDENVDAVQIVFNEFKSVARQEIVADTLLPLDMSEFEGEGTVDYLYEPSEEALLLALLPKHLKMQVWRAFLESYASEQAARMMAMENATENATELISSLTLVYNKARQAAITTEILEIVGGAEALKNG